MKPNIYLEPGYSGRETNAVISASHLLDRRVIRGKGPIECLHVGSVEFIESVIGKQKPDFYPSWTKVAWHRRIQRGRAFIKSASGYKNRETFVDDVLISQPVEFEDEWRHYCVRGESLCSWWYQGNEKTCDDDPHGPELPFALPADFCGAIDIGRLSNGKVALVEVQHAYAIGWYGEMLDHDCLKYLAFLDHGWKSLDKKIPINAESL